MQTCPQCGAELVISHPLGLTTWLEKCSSCEHEGGGTAYVGPMDEIDNSPEVVVYVIDPGSQRDQLFQLYRQVLGVSPADAKTLLSSTRVEVARGKLALIQPTIQEFETAGATLEVATAPQQNT